MLLRSESSNSRMGAFLNVKEPVNQKKNIPSGWKESVDLGDRGKREMRMRERERCVFGESGDLWVYIYRARERELVAPPPLSRWALSFLNVFFSVSTTPHPPSVNSFSVTQIYCVPAYISLVFHGITVPQKMGWGR